MREPYTNKNAPVTGPFTKARAVTPHNDTALTDVGKGLYIGNGGTLIVRCVDDTEDATFVNVPNGALLAGRFSHVRATGTTCSNILVLI